MLKLRKLTSVMLFSGLLAAVGASQAATIAGSLVGGENTFQDESREAYVDVNRDGKFNAGDVIFGFIQVSQVTPSGVQSNNQIYGVFSQQIAASSAASTVNFEATTVAGLKLQDLLGGNVNVNANAISAFYDKSVPYANLTANNATTASFSSMQNYITYIAGGTLELVAGLNTANNFLQSNISPASALLGIGIGSANSAFLNPALDANFTVAGTQAGVDVSYNNTGWLITPHSLFNPLLSAFVPADIGLASGTVGGANGTSTTPNSPSKNWLTATGWTQCTSAAAGANVACGFTDKANYVIDVVPEPGSLALASLALLALGGLTRRKGKSA